MGTLKAALDKVRLRAKDLDKTKFTDAQMVDLANDVLSRIADLLYATESNLALIPDSFDTIVGTDTYTLSTSEGVVFESMWDDDPDYPLARVTSIPVDGYAGSPDRYMETATGVVQVYPKPDSIATIQYQYSANPPAFTDYETDTIPYFGIWDEALMRVMVVEEFEILERDISRVASLANDSWNMALQKTILRGVKKRQTKGSYIGMGYEL